MFISGNGTSRKVREVVDCVPVGGLLSELLSGNFFGCEETTTWTTGATHGVLVTRLVEIRLRRQMGEKEGSISGREWHLSLPGEPVNLF